MRAEPAPAGLAPGLDLLQRALDYTADTLSTVAPEHGGRPTPCAGWSLADLLAHMEDALDAFTEAADGSVGLSGTTQPASIEQRVRQLQTKACALLASWMEATPPYVDVGGHSLPLDTISRIAALEITVHGWDVGQATGLGGPLPERLAAALLPDVLRIALVEDARFAPPLPVAREASAGDHVLALLGRRTAQG